MAHRTKYLDKIVHIRVSGKLHADLVDLAIRADRSESSLMREAIAAYVEHYVKNPEKIKRGYD